VSSPGILPGVQLTTKDRTPLAGAISHAAIAHLRRAGLHNALIPTVETVGYYISLLAEHPITATVINPVSAEHPPQHSVRAELFCSKLRGLCYRQTPFRISRTSACRGRSLACFRGRPRV
jgi:hypothetical protein